MRHGEVKQHDGSGGSLERPRTAESARTFACGSSIRMDRRRDYPSRSANGSRGQTTWRSSKTLSRSW